MTDTLHEEAARYALLRRVLPTLRHHLAGEFQPLGMMAALIERRAQKNDAAGLQEQCAGLGQLSRQAADRCMDLMSWIAPRGPGEIALQAGLEQCVHLLATSLRFRGFALVHPGAGLQARVDAQAIRSVLPAAILYLSDCGPGPADLTLEADSSGTQVQVRIARTAAQRAHEPDPQVDYRTLQWDDVRALARAGSVGVQRWPDAIALDFAIAA